MQSMDHFKKLEIFSPWCEDQGCSKVLTGVIIQTSTDVDVDNEFITILVKIGQFWGSIEANIT